VGRLDLCCDNRGSDLASRPDPDWQAAPAPIPHHVAGSRPCSRARLSIPNRRLPIDADSHESGCRFSSFPPRGSTPSRSGTSAIASALAPQRFPANRRGPSPFPPRDSRPLPPTPAIHLRAGSAALLRLARTRRTRGLEPRANERRRRGLMGGSSTRHGRTRRPGREPALSELDLRILDLLSHHRVLTQTQLAAISAEVPARTLRYRCNRLAKHGLLGRTRPYRERGSAPHHLWPTRRGEAMACGGPPPRGGERREPNPLSSSPTPPGAARATSRWRRASPRRPS
jgi:hypothetical protein